MDTPVTIMRFFTPQWRNGELRDDEYENAYVDYAQRLDLIRPDLPPDLGKFIDFVSLHDAKIRAAALDSVSTFRLMVRAGDLQSGYKDVDITYGDVDILDGNPPVAVLLNSDVEIIEDEFDKLSEGIFEHRLLFAPHGELRISFRQFEFSTRAAEGRRFVQTLPVFRHSRP